MDKLTDLGQKLGIKFVNLKLIAQAFIHRSFLNESKEFNESNERLEFLGDSILSFLVSDYIYKKLPELSEGELTNIRSSIVKTETLSQAAQKLHLGNLLFLSKGEEASGGRENHSILADTFEAFLGAVFLDCGLAAVRKVLQVLLFPLVKQVLQNKSYKDSKSNFQELIQEEIKASPVYRVLKEDGPDHAKEFTIGVFVNEKLLGTGKGRSKQEGEVNAAKAALEKWSKK